MKLIRRLCKRTSVSAETLEAEIAALRRLDIPYFSRRTNGRMPRVTGSPPAELLTVIREALEWTR
jgi:hypothetical protein